MEPSIPATRFESGEHDDKQVQNLLPFSSEGMGTVTRWQRSHPDGEKHRKFNMSTGGKLPANLDFLFSSRLYFEHTAKACA